jgi:hypothetical protein
MSQSVQEPKLERLMKRIAIAFLALCLAGPAWADPPPPGRPPARTPAVAADSAPVPRQITVKVMVVRATNANSTVDPELRAMVARLQRYNYKGFRLVDTRSGTLTDGNTTTFAIAGDRQLEVHLLSHDAAQAKVRLVLFGAKGRQNLDTTVSIHRNRQFLVLGPSLGEDALVLPVSVKY